MKAVVIEDPEGISLKPIEDPSPDVGEAIVKVGLATPVITSIAQLVTIVVGAAPSA